MKILNKVTLSGLKKNKVRTAVTIIGIILSTAMFTAVTTSISSLKNYMIETTIAEEGEWEGSLYGVGQDVLSNLEESEEVKRSFGIYEIGYMNLADTIKNGSEKVEWKDEIRPYLQFCSIIGERESAEKLVRFELLAGRMPENKNEILLPERFINYGNQKFKIGDTISGSIGYREFNGEILTGHNSLVQRESTTNKEGTGEKKQDGMPGSAVKTMECAENLVTGQQVEEFTIVGIYSCSKEHYAMPGFRVFCGADLKEGEKMSLGSGFLGVFFTMDKQSKLFDFLSQYETSALEYDYHSHLLYTSGISKADSFSSVYFGLGGILCIIIVFGSVALIYNAFSISINERIKQFGLLSSIGATKRQLRQSILFEACAVSIFGIPLGIGAGILGMSVTFYILRYRFVGLVGSASIPFSLHIKLWALIVAGGLAFFTVLISAVIPARKAMKISAIEAIRQNSEIRVNRRAVRTRGFLYKLFGMEGMLADKNFRRNRKKYRATVISLFVSIILFISASSFVDYLKDSAASVTIAKNYDFSYYVYPERGYSAQEIRDTIAGVSGVAKAFTVKSLYNPTLIETSLLSQEYVDWDGESGNYGYYSELARQGGREMLFQYVFILCRMKNTLPTQKNMGLRNLDGFQRKGVLLYLTVSAWSLPGTAIRL